MASRWRSPGVAAVGLVLLSGATRAEELTGAGAAFPAPLYREWAKEYARAKGAAVDYQPLGAEEAVRRVTTRAVDFGGIDVPLTAAQARAAPGLVQLPVAAELVAVAYNIPGIGPGLRLTGGVLADIYLGRITRWDDSRVAHLNPGLRLPPIGIVPCHSGDTHTTAVFTRFLGRESPDWQARSGSGNAPHWPLGPAEGDSAGVAARVNRSPGGLGYIETVYAVMNRADCAALRNGAGWFVLPDLAAATLASDADAGGTAAGSYPLTGFTYLLVARGGRKPALRKFLTWALTEGQKSAPGLLYAPLPLKMRRRALASVASLR